MSLDWYGFTRVMMYLFGGVGLFHLSIINRKERIAFIAIALQFLVRATLLFFQIVNVQDYITLNNWIATPSIVLTVLCIYVNLWMIRKY
jgi:hypothetical protein